MKLNAVLLIALALLASCIKPQPTVSPISPLATPTAEPLVIRMLAAYPSATILPIDALVNPGFEPPYTVRGQSTTVASGWGYWYVYPVPCNPNHEGCTVPCPTGCKRSDGRCNASDPACYWAQPEYKETWLAYRVHGGNAAQQAFTYGRQGDYGVTQQVVLSARSVVTFSFYVQGWQCVDYSQCDGGHVSDEPSAFHFRAGIDPDGDGQNLVWGSEVESFDRWARVTVTATAGPGQIGVFTRSRPTWNYTRTNNDVFYDDSVLEVAPIPVVWKERLYLPVVAGGE